MTRIASACILLTLAACQGDPAATQGKINDGLRTVASAYKCYRAINGVVTAVPKDIAAQTSLAAGVALSDADCQAAIAGGTALMVSVKS